MRVDFWRRVERFVARRLRAARIAESRRDLRRTAKYGRSL